MNLRGERASRALLLESEVIEIRSRWKGGVRCGGVSAETLAREYNVTVGCINQIVYNKTWTHLLVTDRTA